jgi:hypothetical protein
VIDDEGQGYGAHPCPMDVVAREPQANDQEPLTDDAEDPYSPGHQALPIVLGAMIALLTAVVPLATVVSGRITPKSFPFDSALTRAPDL